MVTLPNELRVVDSSGTELLALVGVGDYILRALDLGFPEVRDVSEALPGADGEVDSTQHVGARAVTAEVVVPPGAVGVGPRVDALAGLMHPGRRLWLHVKRWDWPAERRILARGASFACPPTNLRVAQLGWHCPKGLFEDVAGQQVGLSPIGSASGGTTFSLTAPFTFATGLVPGAATIDVGGTVAAVPVVDIYGPCSNPLVRVVDTGEQMRLIGDVAAGDFIRLDTGARAITLNGDPNQSRYNMLDFATSKWLRLPAGRNVQVVFSPEAPGIGCMAELRWANRWL